MTRLLIGRHGRVSRQPESEVIGDKLFGLSGRHGASEIRRENCSSSIAMLLGWLLVDSNARALVAVTWITSFAIVASAFDGLHSTSPSKT